VGYLYGLGYVGFQSPDLDNWASFGTEVLGGELTGRSEPEEPLLIRLDDRAFRIMVSEGPDAFGCAGWEVSGYREFDALLEHLTGAGVAVKEEPDLAPLRRVARLASCIDPAGNRVEFFCGALKPKAPIRPARPEVRYVSGALGLGHVVFTVPDIDQALHFYLDLLGFQISDNIRGTRFMRVNQRHHSVAFRELEGESRFRHFSLEVEDLDGVGRTLDAAEQAGTPVSVGLGRHSNDLMVSFYMKTPSGYEVEFGCQGRLVDDATWTTSSYDATSLWGHKRTIPVP
jgi:3,4-dihydroxy-9,10-secoandrosta-1,3,5(10)-triene-9,17-dione 4,5-dioxygenase